MKRTIIMPALITAFVALSPAGVALADNPHDGTTGQPGKTADPANSPPGFGSGGFANAETHYAGSEGTHSLNSNNPKAVSQYDVAGFQWALHHPAP
jgi:hypothetical protein